MSEGVAIIVPMWGRSDRIEALLQSIEETTSEFPHTVWFISCADDEDVLSYFGAKLTLDIELAIALDDRALYECAPDSGVRLVITKEWKSGEPGDYARKINLGYRVTDEPLLFTGAIDLRFRHGWWQVATRKLAQYDGRVGVIGTNDLCNRRTMRGMHSTHSLVTRDYVDNFGTIDEARKVLHESYWHEYVDDEFVHTARYRKQFVHATASVVEHLHPMNGRQPTDHIYDRQTERMEQGRTLFLSRQHLWEGTVRG